MTDAEIVLQDVMRQRAERASKIITGRVLIGKSKRHAYQYVNHRGLRFRAVSCDGVARIVTQDVRTDRINVRVVDDKVVEAYIG